jgi:histidinol phosphatase-like PHP family hydrolase
MFWSSWHNHTGDEPRFSYCAAPDLTPDVYRRALRTGPWHAFALTEHAFALAVPEDAGPWPNQWYAHPERWWAHQAFREDKTARFLDRMAGVCDGERIFAGLEVEVAYDGSLCMDSWLWPYLDVVIGSVHCLPGAPDARFDAYIAQLHALLAHPIDILGHPFRELAKSGPVPVEIIDETLRRVKSLGVAIEINAHVPCAQDAEVLARACAQGVRVAFGLDAHTRTELARHRYFEKVLTASGVEPTQVRLFRPERRAPRPRVPASR